MKESKFIELLNLYVDHHISPAEAALLEAEVRNNPDRRQIYREYCQMQKGCTELAANFRAQAPAGGPTLVEFQPRKSRFGVVAYASGLMAVAAGVAVVFTLRSKQPERVAANPAAPTVVSVAAAKSSAPAVAQTPAARPALQPVFGPRLLTAREQGADLAESSTDQAAFAEWMNGIQFSSLSGVSVDDLRFDAHANLQPDVRTYRASRPIQGKLEQTAFTFQK